MPEFIAQYGIHRLDAKHAEYHTEWYDIYSHHVYLLHERTRHVRMKDAVLRPVRWYLRFYRETVDIIGIVTTVFYVFLQVLIVLGLLFLITAAVVTLLT